MPTDNRKGWHNFVYQFITDWVTSRTLIAVMMLAIAGGRFGFWEPVIAATVRPNTTYAWMFLICGVLLLITTPLRYHLVGHIGAALAASFLAGIVWDIEHLGSVGIIEVLMIVYLVVDIFYVPEC